MSAAAIEPCAPAITPLDGIMQLMVASRFLAAARRDRQLQIRSMCLLEPKLMVCFGSLLEAPRGIRRSAETFGAKAAVGVRRCEPVLKRFSRGRKHSVSMHFISSRALACGLQLTYFSRSRTIGS